MKAIINGKRYDTDRAEELHHWTNGRLRSDFRYRAKTLYRTPGGRFFILHKGGPLTDLAQPAGNGFTYGAKIEPISKEDAFNFLVTHDGVEVAERFFPDRIEDA